ncbi:FAD-dependent oxidoreductase [Castellaniella sp.]|uniref:FAD-dependent oxidoreductase n=1 Tax=Castellaniella sp. TaxID=1955812 RepID=UPI00356165F3
MAIYTVTLAGKKQVAEGTFEFLLSKPEGFKYRAGQFFDILLEPVANAPKSSYVHGFSFASAPFEPNLAAATRMRDTAFKNAIRNLPDGTEVKIDACFGSFTLPKQTDTPVAFLIGGIGITPVRSMIAQASHDQSAQAITLLYANKTPDLAAFTQDLRAYSQHNTHFTFVPVYTDPGQQVDGAESGVIDAAMIRRHVTRIPDTLFYLSGPAGMVRAMRAILMDELHVDEDNIRTEEFDGY